MKETSNNTEKKNINKFVIQKTLRTIIALLLVVVINILINKYASKYIGILAEKVSSNYILTSLAFFTSEIFIGVFPAELFMIVYQSKSWNEYLLIVLFLGLISSLCGFTAFSGGRYLQASKISKMIILLKNFKKYGDLFIKHGLVILILAATTPLPFALVSFIAGYFKFSPTTFLKIIVPVRIIRLYISAYIIKYSIVLI